MNKITLVIVTTIIALTIWPIGIIWGLNTLFGFGIAYTFKTWAAALILSIVVGGRRSS